MNNSNSTSEPPSHRDLLIQAKQQQKQDLVESTRLSEALVKTVNAIVRANSITTIHDLDREIDRQLKKDISVNYEKLVLAKEKLGREIARTKRALDKHQESKVDLLQRRAEQSDQELRILENTLSLIKSQR
ncbi:hypothetical protein CA3LBN_002256 [Candidozyma haemuli]|uniref:Uncharacterized protein n=1 Tax=Candidozyma haemuli TaxID=45357 RepID=A0ABX8I3Y9_9ASCO|nr:hypothetical protein CA3LBN_002256 [[Candida] haemuloni]